ncbi:MAG TPA: hypothetical protein PL033_13920 [Candidatus Brocadiia bacterium]|nr:hypothetical protein [Candidatus Brocadiia bacterium]
MDSPIAGRNDFMRNAARCLAVGMIAFMATFIGTALAGRGHLERWFGASELPVIAGAELLTERSYEVNGGIQRIALFACSAEPVEVCERHVALLGPASRSGVSADGSAFAVFPETASGGVLVRASPAPGGGSRFVVVSSSAGAGDVTEGVDDGVPAPPNSKPQFNVAGRSQSGTNIRLYESAATSDEIGDFYMSRMPQLGWRYDDGMTRRMDESMREGRVLCFAGRGMVSIVNTSEREDGRRTVWIFTSRNGDAPDNAAPKPGDKT